MQQPSIDCIIKIFWSLIARQKSKVNSHHPNLETYKQTKKIILSGFRCLVCISTKYLKVGNTI